MKKLIFLATGHGLNDCISGFILASLMFWQLSSVELGIAVLIYNLIAFGGQVPLAWIIRKNYPPKLLLVISYSLHILSFLFLLVDYKITILAIGTASAIIHVVGGYECKEEHHHARNIGIFASPGVIGLAIGGVLGAYELNIFIPCLLVAVGLIIVTLLTSFKDQIRTATAPRVEEPDKHDLIMILLLTIIAFRSALWNIFQIIHDQNFEMLIFIGIAAMLGKLAGGYLSDYIGLRKYSLIALILSLPFLTILKNNIWGLCAGIFLLQSTLPATAVLMIKKCKHNPALGVAYSFGLPIILGALLFYTPMRNIVSNNWSIGGLLLLCCILLFLEKRRYNRDPGI